VHEEILWQSPGGGCLIDDLQRAFKIQIIAIAFTGKTYRPPRDGHRSARSTPPIADQKAISEFEDAFMLDESPAL
jgi:hypothetical protein